MSGEKTEKPTQKKIDDARKKGQVALSKDAQTVIKLGSFYLFFFWINHSYTERFSKLIDTIVEQGFKTPHHFNADIFQLTLEVFLIITVPLVAVCALAGLISTWGQIGMLVAPEAAAPSFKKFDAVGNIKNMLSKKSLVQLLLSVFKVITLALIAYLVFKDSVNDMVYSYRAGLGPMFTLLNHMLERIIFFSLAIFLVMAVIDWSMERAAWIKNLRMSLHDIKDEYKQTQGDPHMKQKRKSEYRNLLNSSLSKVSSSKVVVANPTHISVALDYEPGTHDLPFIVAMGVDDVAFLIREKAKTHGVPVITNVKLARMLYQDCDEEQYIQKQHLEMAAQVFKVVMEMAAEAKKKGE